MNKISPYSVVHKFVNSINSKEILVNILVCTIRILSETMDIFP